jgi:hypothetical protein
LHAQPCIPNQNGERFDNAIRPHLIEQQELPTAPKDASATAPALLCLEVHHDERNLTQWAQPQLQIGLSPLSSLYCII